MGRLNLFQKTMRAWDESMPYNAVHAVRLRGGPDLDRLREAISGALRGCGYRVDARQVAVEEPGGEGGAEAVLLAATERELNRGFGEKGLEFPFRFFVVPDGGGFVFGLCYFHMVASGDSVCWLLGDIVGRYDGRGGDGITAVTGRPPSDWGLLARHARFIPGWLWAYPRSVRRAHRFARPPRRHAEGARTRLREVPVGTEGLAWIRAARERTGGTFHDVLLGLVFVAIAEAVPGRLKHKRRRNIAVGSIVNIRRFFGEAHARRFGLFLSMFAVSHPVPEGADFDEVVDGIRAQTREIKRRRLFLCNLVHLSAALRWRKFLSPKQKRELYAKFHPLAASVTSFSVDQCFDDGAAPDVDNYWRGVSASPATPLVLSFTTFRGDAKAIVAYDDSVYSDRDIDSFVDILGQQIASSLSPP